MALRLQFSALPRTPIRAPMASRFEGLVARSRRSFRAYIHALRDLTDRPPLGALGEDLTGSVDGGRSSTRARRWSGDRPEPIEGSCPTIGIAERVTLASSIDQLDPIEGEAPVGQGVEA